MSVEIQQISITNLNKDYFTFDRHFSLFQHAHRTIVRFEIVLHKTSCDYVFSLYRSDDPDECRECFNKFKNYLPLLEENSFNANDLNKVCQIIHENHISQNIAHLNVHLDNVRYFRQNLTEELRQLFNDVDCYGCTPLFLALKLKRTKICEELLSRVEIPRTLIKLDFDYNSVFHFAAKNEAKIMQKLCGKIGDRSLVQELINQKNLKNETPLHIACYEDNIDCVTILLKNGANINSASRTDQPHQSDSGIKAELLDKLKVDLNKIKNGGTPLHWCTNHEIIDLLADNGCDLNAKDFNGNTALHVMIERNDLKCTISLLTNGANANVIGLDGMTPLHLAIKIGNTTFIQLLIVFGAKVNMDNWNNQQHSLRHFAANSYGIDDLDKKKIIYILHSLGANRCDNERSDCNEYCSPNGMDNGNYDKSPLQRNNLIVDEFLSNKYFNKNSDPNNNNDESNGNKKNKLLCLDGGGIRGLILIQLLCHLERITNKRIAEIFDWIAGTSTGGILALLLSHGYQASKCRSLYFKLKDKVFIGQRPHSTECFETLIKQYFGDDTRLCDLPQKPRLFITTTNVEYYPPSANFFRNYLSAEQLLSPMSIDNDVNEQWEYLWKVARATSAAPTFFNQCEQYIDGGLVANNPTLDLLTEFESIKRANRIKGYNNNEQETAEQTFDIDIVVSIGTGEIPKRPFTRFEINSQWQIYRKIYDIIELLTEQAAQSNGQVVERAKSWCSMINVPFYRINPAISEEIQLDESDDVKLIQMLWETEAYLHMNLDQMNQLSIRLLE
ncbi:85/88 kDa calcium-independent phospholipase A2 [Dermatophagoides farinae]|uniref:phospholipase A2 n=1 Tax=Dermatophagoides farinae TaxID=6954 RepID=A0A922HV22_DERFA|nr:85/88 kDa calcium-independent phospholipase A2 [Dermatophagoides farinae]